MENNFTTITVDAPAQDVYNAINNVSGWWHGEIKGSAAKLNDEFDSIVFSISHLLKSKSSGFVPNQK